MPYSERARAAIDFTPVLTTAQKELRKQWKIIEQTALPKLIIGYGAAVSIEGENGQGKSTTACRLADGIAGPALLVSAEEGASPSLAARLQRANIKRDDFFILPRASVDQVVACAQRVGAVSLIIDSLQVAAWSPGDLRHVIALVDSLAAAIVVLQMNKRGVPAGENAVLHEVDVRIHVEAMKWELKKSRYQDPAGIGGDVLPPALTPTPASAL